MMREVNMIKSSHFYHIGTKTPVGKMPSTDAPEAVQGEYEKFRATELKASIFLHGHLYNYYRLSLCVSFQN